jgi:hypothetical protein
MDRASLAIFIHELHNQCVYTEAAFRVFNQSVQQNIPAGVFFSAQSTLLCASQISALLWPSQARVQKRGEELREILQLDEKHPLNDERLASMWEHADERLEDWVGTTKGEKVIFDHVGSIEELSKQVPIVESNIFRLYDPTTMTFYFRGDGYKMQAIADSISEIYSRAITVHRQMFPEQHQAGGQPPKDQAENKPETKETKH